MSMTLSMRPDNKYRFNCSVIGREELYMRCMFKRYKFMRGEPLQDADCATCMQANKCPAIHMIAKEHRQGKAMFFDATDTLHQLHKDIHERIAPVMVVRTQGYGTGISDARLSELVGEKVIGLERDPLVVAAPPIQPRAGKKAPGPLFKPFGAGAEASDGLAGAIDHSKDFADHLSAA